MDISRRQALGATALGLGHVALVGSSWSTPIAIKPRGQRQQITMTMAPSEHRGLHLYLGEHRDMAYVQLEGVPADVRYQLARPASTFLPDGRPVLDPLEPLEEPAGLTPENEDLYLRLTIDEGIASGRQEFLVRIESDDGTRTEVDIAINVVPLDLPKVHDELTIQGSVWLPGLDELRADFDPARVMAAMRANDFNAVALLRGLDDVPELARLALDEMGFKQVRLPNHRLLNRRFRPTPEELEDFMVRTDMYHAQFDQMFARPEWQGRLIVKLWDEPKPLNYPDVVESHRYARETRPNVPIELTEEPGSELGDIADIWIVHGKFIDEAPIEQQKAKGDSVWFYGNKLHSIDRDSTSMRTVGWLLWRYRLQGYHFWSVNWWHEDPWSPDMVARGAIFKRGTMFFPSRSEPGDVQTSLRMQAFRDGLQDWRWLRWLDRKAEENGPSSAEARFAEELRGEVDWTRAVGEALDVRALHARLVAFVVDQVGA